MKDEHWSEILHVQVVIRRVYNGMMSSRQTFIDQQMMDLPSNNLYRPVLFLADGRSVCKSNESFKTDINN